MDLKAFQVNTTGKIIPIDGGQHAFVPAALPPTDWTFSPRLWPLLIEAKSQLGLLEGVGRTLPNTAILLSPLEDREALQSSRLEGTNATPRELLLFEMEPPDAPPADEAQQNSWEVFNYRKAMHHGSTSELPLSLRLICELHGILLAGVRGQEKTPGAFRKTQVAIGRDYRFVPPPPLQLMDCLDPFEKAMHCNLSVDPLIDCFLCHYQFEAIHPFNDGNGRVGRLLLAIMVQRRCQLTKPWLYLSEFFEKRKEDYVQRLFEVSTRAAWDDWLELCLQGTIEQSRSTVERCDRLQRIRDDLRQRLSAVKGPVRLNQIVENLFHSPFVQVAELSRRLGITYPTAKADLLRLVQANILRELPNATQKTYYAPEIFDVAYADIESVER